MTSLFSSFDPSTSHSTQLNWLVSLLVLLLMPMSYWIISSPYTSMFTTILKLSHQEIKMLLNIKYTGSTLIMVSLFIMICINNMVGLLPFTFTSTTHLIFPMSISFPLWLSFILFNFLRENKKTFAHLVPEGTPSWLMIFTVMIETLSNLIRPGVIALRLTTNIMAGHILLTLVGNMTSLKSGYFTSMIIMTQLMLLLFEVMVSIVQAYVFSVLMSLYLKE